MTGEPSTVPRGAHHMDQRAERVAAAIARFPSADRERLIALRRALHAEPELAWEERGTQARLRAALHVFGITDVRDVAGTGLMATIPGTMPGAPVIALRGDIDALPITEETGLPFTSRVPGVMHACGHDMHATWVVAAGVLLAREPAHGDVRLLLQPAEEVGEGARKLIEAGAMEGVGAIFGGHVDWRFSVGELVATAGPLAASTDSFEITFHGKGGHGARPQDAHDPIIGLAAFVMEAQTIVSRALDPHFPASSAWAPSSPARRRTSSLSARDAPAPSAQRRPRSASCSRAKSGASPRRSRRCIA